MATDQSPVVTKDANGMMTLSWPNGRGEPFLVAPEVIEGVVEGVGRLTSEHQALVSATAEALVLLGDPHLSHGQRNELIRRLLSPFVPSPKGSQAATVEADDDGRVAPLATRPETLDGES